MRVVWKESRVAGILTTVATVEWRLLAELAAFRTVFCKLVTILVAAFLLLSLVVEFLATAGFPAADKNFY